MKVYRIKHTPSGKYVATTGYGAVPIGLSKKGKVFQMRLAVFEAYDSHPDFVILEDNIQD